MSRADDELAVGTISCQKSELVKSTHLGDVVTRIPLHDIRDVEINTRFRGGNILWAALLTAIVVLAFLYSSYTIANWILAFVLGFFALGLLTDLQDRFLTVDTRESTVRIDIDDFHHEMDVEAFVAAVLSRAKEAHLQHIQKD
jgi:hypothetical protein